ncbi:unnamed protein product [Discosporangium mesarthrocarpum]
MHRFLICKAMSLFSAMHYAQRAILRAEGVDVWMRPYAITALSNDSGVIEAVPDTVSLDALRRAGQWPGGRGWRGSGVCAVGGGGSDVAGGGGEGTPPAAATSLIGFFEGRFGARGSEGFKCAQRRFIQSLAAYSIACYLLQIKDRHNGNILLDAEGRLIHIDFGFMLSSSPGNNLSFENAPFKLTGSMLEVMGGARSRCFREFRDLCVEAFLALRKNSQEVVLLVEMMACGNESLPCFQGRPRETARELADRFQPDLNDKACIEFVHGLIEKSVGSWTTLWYDKYQRLWSGIY